jgi:RNA polymerase sigma-70 factor (ECF subfamily)
VTKRLASSEYQGVGSDFRAVFEREFAYVWESLRRLGVREADLQDQAQEVFVVVHSIFSTFDATRAIRPWLFGIAWRTASRYRSSARLRREVTVDDLDPVDERADVDAGLEGADAQRLFARALRAVDDDRRPVFIMMEVDGFSAKEAAEVLGIPANTVYSRLRLAREEFARAALRLRGGRERK